MVFDLLVDAEDGEDDRARPGRVQGGEEHGGDGGEEASDPGTRPRAGGPPPWWRRGGIPARPWRRGPHPRRRRSCATGWSANFVGPAAAETPDPLVPSRRWVAESTRSRRKVELMAARMNDAEAIM